jgi:hypothetical protein
MNRLYNLRPHWLLLMFIVLDTVLIGMGMGLPIFCILFGFISGWFLVKAITFTLNDRFHLLRRVLLYAIVASGITFVEMARLWLPFASYLFDPTKDLTQTGIPMILYEPQASLIGWIVLMVFISPFLQLLTTVFSAYLTLLARMNKSLHAQKAI